MAVTGRDPERRISPDLPRTYMRVRALNARWRRLVTAAEAGGARVVRVADVAALSDAAKL
jgi:hypothetical protein